MRVYARRCTPAWRTAQARSALVFANQVGNVQDDRRLQEVFKRVLKRAGLSGHFTPHCLRHSYVQRQLGHATIRLTVDLYGGWLPAGNHECADRYEAAVFARDVRSASGLREQVIPP